jgi:hypothetical protein
MALIPGAVEANWLCPLDLLYSHTLFLGDVPPRLSAVAIWMDRLVAFEVCPSCCSGFLLLISSQSEVIQFAGLGDLPEEQLDDWFAARGIRCAEIRARIGPFATASWVKRFPRYAAALGPELDLYESVVGVALRLQGGSRSSLGEEAQMRAFNSAGEVISSRHARGLFPSHLHEQFWYRLSLGRLAVSGPRLAFEPYALPLLDSPAYAGHAPRPSLGEVAPRSTGGFDDVALTYVHSQLARFAARLLGRDPSRSPSRSSDDAGPSVLRSGRVLPRLPVVNVSAAVPVVEEVVPVFRGRGRGRPRGRMRGSGRILGRGHSASRNT